MKWFSLQTVLQIKHEDKYGYPDPTPTEMNHVNIKTIDININASYNLYTLHVLAPDVGHLDCQHRLADADQRQAKD